MRSGRPSDTEFENIDTPLEVKDDEEVEDEDGDDEVVVDTLASVRLGGIPRVLPIPPLFFSI